MIQQMQKSLGVTVDGEAGPKTANALELRLMELGFSVNCWGRGELVMADFRDYNRPSKEPTPVKSGIGDWMQQARKVIGRHERADRDELIDWLRSDGATLGDPSQLPWCGDFVDTALALAGFDADLDNPYLARNWNKVGQKITPRFGAIMVFWRGRKDGKFGHVGFYMDEDETHFHILGGNQGNSVSVSRLAKNRLLGARWPTGAPMPERFHIRPGSTTINEA